MGAAVGVFCTVTAYNDPDFHPRATPTPTETIVVVRTVAPTAPAFKVSEKDCDRAAELGDKIRTLVVEISGMKGDTKNAVYDANRAIVGRNWKELQNLTVKLRAASSRNDPLFIELVDINTRFKEAVSSCVSSS